jgi:ATP-dependent Clp protease ATP-binding subunit ClpC
LFERFTDRARQVVVLAQDEARALRHNYIGTEHLLLGLLREEEGLAARALEALDVDYRRVREEIVRSVGEGSDVHMGQIPFTPRAKGALELSLREALSLGHDSIGTEHVLLGLVRVRDSTAGRALAEHGVQPIAVYEQVTSFLGVSEGARPPFEQEEVEDDAFTSVERDFTIAGPARPHVVQAGLLLAAGLALGVLVGWLLWG